MIRSFVVGVVVMLALAGCTEAKRHPNALVSPHGVSSQGAKVPIGIPEGEVGRAPITSVDGRLLGTIVFSNTSQGIVLELPSGGFGDAETIALADSPFSATSCGADNIWELGFDLRDPHPPTLESGMYAGGDPSFFTAIVIARTVPDATGSECPERITATGPITWSIPLQRPWVHPMDQGSRVSAVGAVGSKDGIAMSYTTAAGDTWRAIAARFGISSEDLEWLNPNRLGGSTPGEAYAQQVLNLDPNNRGDSESRRPH